MKWRISRSICVKTITVSAFLMTPIRPGGAAPSCPVSAKSAPARYWAFSTNNCPAGVLPLCSKVIVMAFFTQFLHQISYRLTRRSQQTFERAATQLQASQLARFRRIMALVSGSENGYKLGLTQATTPDEFRQRVAVSEYEDWQPFINRQRTSGTHILTTEDCQRYQPTSGSTSQIKWIPYTPAFLHELDQTISPWVADLYQRFPGIRQGRHYWSLSWVPGELRSAAASVNDDLQLLPWWKRLFMRHTMAVPEQVSLAPSSELSLFASLCYLRASRDLTLMSVWSPTFLLSLLEQLGQQRDAVAQVLEQ